MNIKIDTTCNYRKSVVLKIQLKMCKHPELVKSVAAAWGTGAQVNLNGWGLMGYEKQLHKAPILRHNNMNEIFINDCTSSITSPNSIIFISDQRSSYVFITAFIWKSLFIRNSIFLNY